MRRVWLLVVFILAVSSRALAQRPAPTDTARTDSTVTDSVRLHCIECAGYAMLVSVAAFFYAPAAILVLLPGGDSSRTLSRPAADFASFSVEGRVIGDTAQTGGHSESVQWSRNGTYVELRVATWYIPQTFQYETIRVGWLVQPRSKLAGGVTLGYQRVPRDWSQEGPEVALPVVIGGRRARLRSEASYVFSPKRVNISYRCQAEVRISSGPLHAGIDFELKSVREPTPFTGGISVMLIVRP